MKTYSLKYSLLIAAAAMFTFTSCSSEDHEDILGNWIWGGGTVDPDPEPEPDPEPTDANPNIVEAGWVNVTDQFEGVPDYLNVYKKDKTTDGDAAVAYIAVADASKAKFELASDMTIDGSANSTSDNVYTPTEFYNNNDKPAVVINGGLFFWSDGKYYSQSSFYKDGQMLSANQTYWTVDWVEGHMWYPTLGFFFQDKDGNFHAQWSYYSWTGKDYLYDEPRKCDPEVYDTESPAPSSVVLNDGAYVKNGIGGVGVLVHDGIQVNTWQYEMMDVSGGSNQPRTAVGYAKNTNRIVFFVCEGREATEGVHGMTLDEVSAQMAAIGCTEAMALDGGGSSCMLIGGKETIKPCNEGNAQRATIDACFIR